MDLRIFSEPQQGATYGQLLGVARAAEDHGFDAFFRSDHYLAIGGDGSPGPTDAWVTLGALARETSRIRLGTLVTAATFRLPGPLDIAVAQVDEMSGGRVELGLGSGWYEAEHTAYGIDFPPLGSASTVTRSSSRSSPGCGRPPRARPSPSQGSTTGSSTPPPSPSRCSAQVRPSSSAAAAPAGLRPWPPGSRPSSTCRSPPSSASPPNATGCRRRARRSAATRTSSSTAWPWWCAAAPTRPRSPDGPRPSARATPAELRENGAAGLPGEVVDTLGRYADAGASRVYLQVLDVDDLDHVALLGRSVLPDVR